MEITGPGRRARGFVNPWVQLEKYFDFSLYSHHFSLLSLTSLLSAPEREVTSPSDFKVVGALIGCKIKRFLEFSLLVEFISKTVRDRGNLSTSTESYQLNKFNEKIPLQTILDLSPFYK